MVCLVASSRRSVSIARSTHVGLGFDEPSLSDEHRPQVVVRVTQHREMVRLARLERQDGVEMNEAAPRMRSTARMSPALAVP